MAQYLLNLVYLATLVAAAPWMAWRAARTGRYREGWLQKFFGWVPKSTCSERSIWLHAVSVGEVQLLRPLIAEIESQWPETPLVISSTTQTGYQLARKLFAKHTVCYFPMDFSWAIKNAIERIRPKLILLAELELWPNLVRIAKQRGVKVAVVNGRLSERSFRGYGHIGWLTGRTLKRIDWIAVQDGVYGERFVKLGAIASKVTVTGSMKFDGAEFQREHPEVVARQQLLGLKPHHRLWVVGSTQAPEERYAMEAFSELAEEFPDLRLLLVPRHPERFEEIAEQLKASRMQWLRRSQVGNFVDADHWQVVLADSVGELRWWWGLADLGFVGGSFGNRGGQNMIEPTAYGVCTSFGPNTKNFRDIVRLLLDANGAVVLNDPADMVPWVREMLNDPAKAKKIAERGRQVARHHRGATRRTLEGIVQLLSPSEKRKRRAA